MGTEGAVIESQDANQSRSTRRDSSASHTLSLRRTYIHDGTGPSGARASEELKK